MSLLRVVVLGDHQLTHDTLGGLYMLCLAAEMSEGIEAAIQTDTVGYDRCGTYLRFGQPVNISRETDAPRALFHLDIEFPSPAQLADVRLPTVLEFRSKYVGERQRFRQMVEDLLAHARTLDNVPALQDYFAMKRTDIEEMGREYRERIKGLVPKATSRLLKTSVPTLAVSAATALVLPDAAAAALGIAGISVAATEWFTSLRQEYRDIKRDHPARYAALVQRQFGG